MFAIIFFNLLSALCEHFYGHIKKSNRNISKKTKTKE